MTSARDKHYFGRWTWLAGRQVSDFGSKRKLVLLCTMLILSFGSLLAQEIKLPAKPDPPRLVNDYTATLSKDEAATLENKLETYTRETSTRISVVIIPSLGGAEINQFATELFNKWEIGEKGKDNGVLLLIAKDDRKLFISTGRGVEEFLPDAICKRIINQTIRPQFKAGNYYQGITAGVDEMQARLTGQFKGDDHGDTAPIKFKWSWIIIGIIIIFVLVSLFGGGGGGRTYSGSGSSGLWFLLGALSSGGGRGGDDWGGGSSGGGFGGFGGGSSGGGGAGGDW